MTGLTRNGAELGFEYKMKRIAAAGFDGVDAFIPKPEEAERWRSALDGHGLALSVNIYPSSVGDARRELERAAAYEGEISAVNAQVMTPFRIGAAAEELLAGIAGLAAEFGLPVNVETHRGTITQDLIRTAEYVRRIPELRLTADLSHYVLAGEMQSVPDEAERLFALLLSRADCVHARVSNGEQIQVDIGSEDEPHPMLSHYMRWWEAAMSGWRSRHPGGGDLLFIPELGPPAYAITTDEIAGRSQEFSDRWEQSLTLQRIARRLWERLPDEAPAQ